VSCVCICNCNPAYHGPIRLRIVGWPRLFSGPSGTWTAGCERPTTNGRARGPSDEYSWFLLFSDRPSREKGSEFCWAQRASWRVEDSPQGASRHDKAHTNYDFRDIRSLVFPVNLLSRNVWLLLHYCAHLSRKLMRCSTWRIKTRSINFWTYVS